jgi:hypothetical protein
MADNYSILGGISSNLNNYIVRPLNAFGVGGFVFDIEGETSVNLTTEITDHFIEDGSTIQDHIAVKPKKVTLKSYVGEVVDRQDDNTQTAVQKAVQKLTVINSFLPVLTQSAQQALNYKKAIEDSPLNLSSITSAFSSKTINRVSDYWAFVKNMVGNTSKQQQAYMYFKALMEEKIIVSIQTPFEFMSKMAIESIVAIQQEGTKYVSDFSITLKEIRTAVMVSPLQGKYGGQITRPEDWEAYLSTKAAQQSAAVTNQGAVQGIVQPLDMEAMMQKMLAPDARRLPPPPPSLP